ncbi:MAG TPA: hypothetical protein VIB11_04930 [Pedococcus sp.]|uniref:hypothetical protein n=1 Tax=Pedococcus sp. TaxID=2860345 RepID=UPI002F943240
MAATLAGVAVLAAGCSSDPAAVAPPAASSSPAPTTPDALARESALSDLLRARAAAVLARDRAGFTATLDNPRSGFGLRQLELFDNLSRLPLGTFAYGTPEPAPSLAAERAAQVGPDAWVARVSGRYSLAGYDAGQRSFETHLTVVRRGSAWRLADDSDGGSQPQLWDLPDLTVVRSRTTLVVGSGPASRLREYLRLGDEAVARVSRVWTQPWGSRVVLVVPRTAAQMSRQLGQDAGSVGQVAAVTDGSLGADGRAGADRVVVNPEALARLQPAGRRVVITHETTHVAVRASTTRPVPLWLSEGMADYVGYSGLGLPRARVAAELLERVRAGQGPTALPSEGDFDPATTTIAPSYNAAWLAVSLIADRHGSKGLVRFYTHAATLESAQDPPGDPAANTEAAFRDVLGTTGSAFTRDWLGYLRALARS